MLSVAEITPIPEERELIEELGTVFSPLYRTLPYHSYEHARDDVLAEALRLDDLDADNSMPRGRFKLIASALGHDALCHLPLDPLEGFRSKEERAAAKIKAELPAYGYSPTEIGDIAEEIISTAPGADCTTPNQIKLRRADISNIAGKRTEFLAASVKIFHEEKILRAEAKAAPLDWRTFVIKQQAVLLELLSQDLSVSSEYKRVRKGPLGTKAVGPFNRDAMRNVSWLHKNKVRDPRQFISIYRRVLEPLIPDFPDIFDITG